MSATEATDPIQHDLHDGRLITGEAVALDLRPTGFVLRAAGGAIDFLVYFGLYIAITVLTFMLVGILFFDEALGAILGVVTIVVCFIIIPTTVELLSHGKSLGRLAVGARIVRDDGGAIGFRHAFIRSLTGVLEIFMTFGGFAVLVGLLNDRSKRLGDLVAGTYSQHERVSKIIPPVFGVPAVLTEWSRTADVARLPDPLARRMAQYLAQVAKLTPASRARLAQELAAEASVYVSPVPHVDAELFVAAVSAMRRDRELTALQLEQQRLALLGPALSGLPNNFPKRA
jgi:uncharacterized RDD family membrane protein YckC